MKISFEPRNLKPLSFGSIFILALTLIFASCKKDDNASISAYVMVTNSAEGSTPQDFYIDNARVSASALAYTQSSNYIATKSGNHTGQFDATGTTTADATIGLSLSGNSYYEVFYTSNNSAVAAQNDRTTPQPGKCRVRFINLSQALSSNVDFAISGGSTVVSGLAYKAFSTYYDVDAAATFSLMASGSSTVLLNIRSLLQAGHIYTIYISGATTATLSAHAIAEN